MNLHKKGIRIDYSILIIAVILIMIQKTFQHDRTRRERKKGDGQPNGEYQPGEGTNGGEYQPGEGTNGGEYKPQEGTYDGEYQPRGGTYDGKYKPQEGTNGGEYPNMNQNKDSGDEPEDYCFTNATKPVYRILSFCRCEVFARQKTFLGPDLSPIFQTLGLRPYEPKKVGGKKQPCKPDYELELIITAVRPLKEVFFLQIKDCFWKKLGLIQDNAARWTELENVLDKFHIEQEKKDNITKLIEDCKENAKVDEDEEKEEEKKEEEIDLSKLNINDFKEAGTILGKLKKKLEAGGVGVTDNKIGKCIKENLNKICRDFLGKKPPKTDLPPMPKYEGGQGPKH